MTLKKALTEAPVIARPDFSKAFTVESDASAKASAAVFSQEQADGEHPILFVGRVLTKEEVQYTTTERYCLALVWSIKKLRPYRERFYLNAITDPCPGCRN